jgi:hypothetical protein
MVASEQSQTDESGKFIPYTFIGKILNRGCV